MELKDILQERNSLKVSIVKWFWELDTRGTKTKFQNKKSASHALGQRFINCSCLGFPWNKRANLGLWIFDNFGTTVNVNLTFLWRLKNWQFWTKPDISPSAPAHILALFGSFIFNSLRSMVSTFVNGVQQLIWTFPGASQRFGGRVGAVQTKYKVSIGRCSSAAGAGGL